MSIGKLVVYTKSWCGDCHRTKRFLNDYEIAFDEIDVEAQPEHRETIRQINGGHESVPVVVFLDGSTLTEPSNAAVAQKLGIEQESW